MDRLLGCCSEDRLRTLFAIKNINPSEFTSSCIIRCNINVMSVGGQQSFVSLVMSGPVDCQNFLIRMLLRSEGWLSFLNENATDGERNFLRMKTFNKQAAFMNFNFLSAFCRLLKDESADVVEQV